MSSWDYIDEVDIFPKLPPNFDELRQSKKWQERKEALEALLKLLTDNERLSTKVSYAELIGNLQTILAKDANINVQALAAKCIGKFATGLRTKFSPFAAPVLPVIFEKMKEKKPMLREPLVECSNEVGRTLSSLDAIQEDVLAALGKPNPQIKQQTALFVARQFDIIAPAKQPKALIKAIVPVLGKLSGDADADVREAALQSLGAVQRIIGEKNVKSLLGDVANDEAKLKKIGEFAVKSAATFAEEQSKNEAAAPQEASTSSAPAGAPKSSGGGGAAAPVEEPQEADPWDFLDAFDLMSKLPEGFDAGVDSNQWKERKKSMEDLYAIMSANPKLEPKANYGALVERLQKVLEKDANINVAALSANCLTCLANGLRTKFQPFAVSVTPVIFEKFKEKKPTLRDPLIACIDAVLATTNLEALGEFVLVALGKPNPSIKTQTDLFLQRAFMKLNSQTMPKKTLKTFVPMLIKHSGDSDSEVRDASFAAMGAMMRAIGEKPALQLLADIVSDNLKMGKIKEYHQKALAEAGPAEIAAMVQSIHKSDAPPAVVKKAPKPVEKEVEEEVQQDEEEEPLKLPAGEKKVEKKKVSSAKENAENEPPVAPKQELLLTENNEKAQRIKEEKQLKLVKWNFQSPTDEHISQLQNQFSAQAKVALMTQLFHKDFKQHLIAIESLMKLADLAGNAILANSDLIFKWCTLRFFETNPSVLIKVLELCKTIANLIRETDTQMSPEELTSFVPYLLLKTGEPKENMRNAVRDIINILSDVVGPLRMTPMLLDALKSKNARQRSECLLVIEWYISTAGIAPLKSLTIEKIVAVHVGDKDVNVRNAAINVLVACFKFEGDQMWRAAGRMSDKDRSLVEERIKRSGVKAGSGVVATTPPTGGPRIVVPEQKGTAVRRPASRSRTREPEGDDEEEEEDVRNSTFRREAASERQSSTRYALRDDMINDALSRLNKISSVKPVITPPPTNGWAAQPTIKRTNSSSSISSIDTSDQIQRSINNISSSLPDVAQDAMFQVTYVLNQPEQRHLVDRQADLVFRACSAQLELVLEQYNAGRDIKNTMEACTQMLFILMGGVEQEHGLEPLKASSETVKSIISSVLRCIVFIGNSEEGFTMARSLNRLAMRLIYRVELSNLLCGLIMAITASFGNPIDITSLICKLSSKWCEELEKRRAQMRASDIVEALNAFYIKAITELKMDIANAVIMMVDNCLERVILQQGDVVLDAARRLSRPHMHLTSMINKILQMMREQGTAPILPGTLEERRGDERDEEGVVTRSGVQVLVDNILRDPSSAGPHIEQLRSLVGSSEKTRGEYAEFVASSDIGEFVSELVETYKSHRIRFNHQRSVDASMTVFKASSVVGAPEIARVTPIEQMLNNTILRTPIAHGDKTISRTRVGIRQPRKTTMSRDQLDAIKSKLKPV